MFANATSTIADGPAMDCCVLEQYHKQVNRLKRKSFDIHVCCNILPLDGNITDLIDLEAIVSQGILDRFMQVHRLVHSPAPVTQKDKLKLINSKISAFNGKVMN